jgi:hypothetical protein
MYRKQENGNKPGLLLRLLLGDDERAKIKKEARFNVLFFTCERSKK